MSRKQREEKNEKFKSDRLLITEATLDFLLASRLLTLAYPRTYISSIPFKLWTIALFFFFFFFCHATPTNAI